MYKREKIAVCVSAALIMAFALSVQPRPAAGAGEKFIEEFKAVVSSDTIKVGESAVVTLSGGQFESIWASKDVPFDWKSYVTVTRIDKNIFRVKGLAPGNAVLRFRNGDKEAVVKVTVVVGGLN
jgi:hypothetical protein